jgi:cation transport ATPase
MSTPSDHPSQRITDNASGRLTLLVIAVVIVASLVVWFYAW